MANTLYNGSSGDEVKRLQELLNSNGYSLEIDGQYGNKTEAAVRSYQKANGLGVDGITGSETWGSLNSKAKKSASYADTTAVAPEDVTASSSAVAQRPTYSAGNSVLAAKKEVSDWEKAKPPAYEGGYGAQINEMLNKVLNRESFNYDLNADALYRQYAEQYAREGRRAMEDTVGNAAALTGGYASSYGVTAGSEAYQSYLEKLNDVIPKLREAAYNKYLNEKSLDESELALLRELESDDYSRYRDSVTDYYTRGDYLQSKAEEMSNSEWQEFLQLVDEYEKDRTYGLAREKYDYDREQDEIELAYKKEQDALNQSNWERQYALSAAKAAAPSSKSEIVKEAASKLTREEILDMYKKGYIEYPLNYKDFCDLTGYSGILTEDEFLSRREYKYKYESYREYLEEMFKEYY